MVLHVHVCPMSKHSVFAYRRRRQHLGCLQDLATSSMCSCVGLISYLPCTLALLVPPGKLYVAAHAAAEVDNYSHQQQMMSS